MVADAPPVDPVARALELGPAVEEGLIDGHPDGTLTFRRFGPSYALGGRGQGGGFKGFRPQRLVGGRLERARNRELPLFDGASQWDRPGWRIGDQTVGYHEWVRATLAGSASPPDPVAELREQLRALCREVTDRAEAVDAAVSAGLPRRPHPDALPWNIFSADGDWERYSTPSRDARLKVAGGALRELVLALPAGGALRAAARAAWQEEAERPGCQFSYRNTQGQPVALALGALLDRLFALSFDPYHCPELRWGAPEGSAERATCPADRRKELWYERERRLRHVLERSYDHPTPLGLGPEEPPPVDPRPALAPPPDGP